MAKNILILDDNQTMLAILSQSIQGLGHHVFEAQTPQQAFDILDQQAFDIHIIFVDYIMPEMSGFEFIQRFCQRTDTQHIYTVLSSGQDLETKAQQENIKIDSFLQKPYTVEVLSNVIQQQCHMTSSQHTKQDLSPEPILDEHAFQTCQDTMGHRFMPILQDYLQQARTDIVSIIQAYEQRDFETIRMRAHTLKSSSATLGALSLAKCCNDLEELSEKICNEQTTPDTFDEALITNISTVFKDTAYRLDQYTVS